MRAGHGGRRDPCERRKAILKTTCCAVRVEGVKYGEATDGSDKRAWPGALMGLFFSGRTRRVFTKDTAIMTCTTGENGAFAFENVPYGHFIVAEIEAPRSIP